MRSLSANGFLFPRFWTWRLLYAAVGGLLACGLAVGCSVGVSEAELHRRGFRSDDYYLQRQERVVEEVFVRERRVERSRQDQIRMEQVLLRIWLRQQARRVAARQRTVEERIVRRSDFLQKADEKELVRQQIRAEDAAALARTRAEFQIDRRQ